ncbi:MAG: hypothetical protein QOH79_2147 [Acidimicrobiaceae bacterium]|jgi:uncharacterized membrane protein
MAANLLLAALPFVLALALFAPHRQKTAGWWVGVVAFVAFLPNAPYVLTDVIHLATQSRAATTDAQVLALVLQYAVLMATGLAFYGGCLAVLRRRLLVDGLAHWRWPAEIGLHAVCSIGIFLGRFLRLNSWDLVVRPGSVFQYVGVPRAATIVIIAFTFCVLLTTTVALRVPLAIHDLRRASR